MLLRLENATAAMSDMIYRQERTANNLANADTIGYKRDRSFTQVLEEQLDADGNPVSDQVVVQWSEFRFGALKQTGNPLDVALEKDGFFVLTDEATGAARYTRAGGFTVDNDGFLRSPAGLMVEGQGGPIQLDPNSSKVEISKDGEIRSGGQAVGQLRVVTFANPEALIRQDASTFDAGNQMPEDVDDPSVRQGFLESSNVDAVEEMSEMIQNFRLFESLQRTMASTDETVKQATNELGTF